MTSNKNLQTHIRTVHKEKYEQEGYIGLPNASPRKRKKKTDSEASEMEEVNSDSPQKDRPIRKRGRPSKGLYSQENSFDCIVFRLEIQAFPAAYNF